MNYNKIEVTPNDPSNQKNIKIHCDAEFKTSSNIYEITEVSDKDYSDISEEDKWYYCNPSVEEIPYATELEYLNEFNVYDPLTVMIDEDYRVITKENIKRKIPPKPIIRYTWNDKYLRIDIDNIKNYINKYIIRVIIDGTIQYSIDDSYFIYNEGTHVIYVEFVDDEALEMNYTIETIVYERKYKTPAPNIVYNGNEVTIYYHPESTGRINYYEIKNVNEAFNDIDAIEFKNGLVAHLTLRTDQKLRAFTKNNPDILYQDNKYIPISNSEKHTIYKYENNSWKDQYNDYIKYKKIWNIEYSSLPEIAELIKGHGYWEGYVKKFQINEPSIKPEVIGVKSNDNVFSCFPHVKRYPGCNYYAYINGESYALGQSVDSILSPINKKLDITVGCEYNGSRETTNITNVTMDTVFPAYPKLTEDVESIMTEPFEINILRESDSNGRDIQREAYLNDEKWILDSEKIRDRYKMEDGEYMIDMIVRKESNGTFRYRSSYFTINTFQHVPLHPLKTKIVPLKISNSPTIGTEGELVLDSNSGHYGIVRNVDGKNEIYSPTSILSSELLKLEEISNEISKLYLDCKKRLDTLLERYHINSDNMINVFSGTNWDTLKSNIINEELEEIYEEAGYQTGTIDENSCMSKFNNSKNKFESFTKPREENLKAKINESIDRLTEDSKTAFTIVRNKIPQTFSNLKQTIQENHKFGIELELYLDNKFNAYKERELKKFEDLEYILHHGGDINEWISRWGIQSKSKTSN